MPSVIKWELAKLLRQKKTYIAVLFIAGFILLLGFSYRLLQQLEGTSEIFYLHPLTFVPTVLTSVSFLVILFMILAVVEMFAGEYNSGTLKMTLLCPVKRSTVFWGKMIAVWLFVLLLLAATVLISLAVGYIFLDSSIPLQLIVQTEGVTVEIGPGGEIPTPTGLNVKAFNSPAEIFASLAPLMLLASLPVMAFAAIVAILAVLLNSAAAVYVVALSLHLVVLDLLAYLLELEQYILSSTHFNLPQLIMYTDKPWSEMAAPFAVLLAYLALGILIGTWLFRRKQILL